MENASRALIMAAEILLGIMIISIGVFIFNEWGEYSKKTTQQITDTQIAEFNNQFLKYYGDREDESGIIKPIRCTIHDVVSIANLAQKNNDFNQVTDETTYSDKSVYIRVDFKSNTTTVNNLEKKGQDYFVTLIKNHDVTINSYGETDMRYFKVSSYNIGDSTKKVNYMKFIEMRPDEI